MTVETNTYKKNLQAKNLSTYHTWEGHVFRMFDNRGEVTRDCRKLPNEEFHNMHSSPRMTKLRRMRCARHVAWMGAMRNV
jgi:hypothetical protein